MLTDAKLKLRVSLRKKEGTDAEKNATRSGKEKKVGTPLQTPPMTTLSYGNCARDS